MIGPGNFPQEAVWAIERGDIGVIKPHSYKGDLDRRRPGVWSGKTKASCPDSCIASTIPLYLVNAHSPLVTERAHTIYYEVRISSQDGTEDPWLFTVTTEVNTSTIAGAERTSRDPSKQEKQLALA